MFASLDMIHDFNYFFSFKIKGDKHDDYIQDDRDHLEGVYYLLFSGIIENVVLNVLID